MQAAINREPAELRTLAEDLDIPLSFEGTRATRTEEDVLEPYTVELTCATVNHGRLGEVLTQEANLDWMSMQPVSLRELESTSQPLYHMLFTDVRILSRNLLKMGQCTAVYAHLQSGAVFCAVDPVPEKGGIVFGYFFLPDHTLAARRREAKSQVVRQQQIRDAESLRDQWDLH